LKRKIGIIVILSIMCSMLTACYDRREIDDMAYVIAVGFDKGETNHLKMTLQFAVPTKSSSGEGGGGGGGEGSKSASITTVETPTIYAGLNMINTYVSKEVNFSHAKIVVFSEELAREGIHEYIHAMIRNREFRGSMHVAVARGSAEEYIQNVIPTLEINLSKYYEMNLDTFKYTGFTGDTRLINFYLFEECTCRQAYATLVGVNKYEKSSQFDISKSTYKEKGRDYPLEGDFYAGEIPKVYEIKSEIMGIAVFDGGTMVGELDGEEAMFHQMLYGTYNHSYITIPDPIKKDEFVVLDVKQNRMPDHHVEMVDGKPQISTKVRLEANILSIQSGENYESMENIPILENAAQDFLKNGMLRFLNKTKEMNADLCGFGRDLKERYLLWDDWTKVHWLKRYKDSTFSVNVELKIRRPGLMVRSAPAKGSKGDEIE
jgi:germination protein, Ger(x)C family